jgi:hypothetical protein
MVGETHQKDWNALDDHARSVVILVDDWARGRYDSAELNRRLAEEVEYQIQMGRIDRYSSV